MRVRLVAGSAVVGLLLVGALVVVFVHDARRTTPRATTAATSLARTNPVSTGTTTTSQGVDPRSLLGVSLDEVRTRVGEEAFVELGTWYSYEAGVETEDGGEVSCPVFIQVKVGDDGRVTHARRVRRSCTRHYDPDTATPSERAKAERDLREMNEYLRSRGEPEGAIPR